MYMNILNISFAGVTNLNCVEPLKNKEFHHKDFVFVKQKEHKILNTDGTIMRK